MANTAFTSPFQSFNADTFTKFFTVPDSMSSFARESMAATTKSTQASVKGFQDVSTTVLRQFKDQVTLSVETGKKLADVDSVESAFEVQSAYVKSAVEANMKGFTELAGLVSDTMAEALAPIAQQTAKATKTAKAAK